jgi:hypothetical protein
VQVNWFTVRAQMVVNNNTDPANFYGWNGDDTTTRFQRRREYLAAPNYTRMCEDPGLYLDSFMMVGAKAGCLPSSLSLPCLLLEPRWFLFQQEKATKQETGTQVVHMKEALCLNMGLQVNVMLMEEVGAHQPPSADDDLPPLLPPACCYLPAAVCSWWKTQSWACS